MKNNINPLKLEVGEAVFWKDAEILHGRNGFKPKKDLIDFYGKLQH